LLLLLPMVAPARVHHNPLLLQELLLLRLLLQLEG
jgi:hypothetical protein